ncbi:Uncharacterised protein [Vibrio cholerae]|nr:Uncharacterised protein [Vibrio cholerae]
MGDTIHLANLLHRDRFPDLFRLNNMKVGMISRLH